MLKIKTNSNNQIDIENKSIEISDRVSADGDVTIAAKAQTEIKIIKATAAKAIITDKCEIPITIEDAKSVSKVVGILRAPFAESAKQNSGNSSTETSDEFTYERTPGTISKLFIHVGEFTRDYDTYRDLEKMFGMNGDTKPTLQEICENKVVLPLPIYALYKNNGDVEAAENYLMPMLKKSPVDSGYSDENSEGSMFVIVDGDGIERPDFIGESKDSYLYEAAYGKKNFLDQLFYAFKHPESKYIDAGKLTYNWPFKLVKENLVKSVVVDANLTMDNTCTDIINVIKTNKEKLGITDDVSDGLEFSYNVGACHAYVLSSDLLFKRDNWCSNEIMNSSSTFAEFWAKESSDSRPSASDNWKGVYVIQKAIEEGRALDIFVEKKRVAD